MRVATRFTAGFVVTLTLASSIAAESPRATPKSVSIVIVPSQFDTFLVQTGNVNATFRDGHTEVWTHEGDCLMAKLSRRGNVGWVRIDTKSVDIERKDILGKDSLVIRLLDGTAKEFPPTDDNVNIMNWAFADHDTTVIVRSMGHHGPSSYVKYEISTGRVIADVGCYTPPSQ